MTDIQRYELLFKKWYKAAVYIAELMIQNEGDAEDIATDAFVKLFQAKYFGTEKENKMYIITCIKNSCFDYRRHNEIMRRNHDKIAYASELSENFNEFFDTTVIQLRALESLPLAIDSLPKMARHIIKEYFRGKDTAQIASQMNIAKRTVLNQKTRAISLLRAAIAK